MGLLLMARTSRVELYAAIRREARAGSSYRELAAKFHISRRTVRDALLSAWPAPRKPVPDRGSRLDSYKPVIDEILRADLNAPRKQRHTITRIHDRLCAEQSMVGVSYQLVRKYVASRLPQIRAEAGHGPVQVFIAQSHLPGVEAEVDFGEVAVNLRGQLTTCALFAFRLSYSGKSLHRASLSAGQEAFLEGHVHALNSIGGVPAGQVRYDNLKAAVATVLGFSRQRIETQRWIAFRSHYSLDAFYCQPGLQGAHEKGGVEGQIGWFRRNHLVPVPCVDSIAELNEMIDQWDAEDERRRIGARPHTIGEAFALERPLLKPLPEQPFETGIWLTPRVDRYSQITVRTNRYSVPVRLIGRQVRVHLHASFLTVYDSRVEVTCHERVAGKSSYRLDLDHYLEALVRKPGALPGSTVLEQARKTGRFTSVHDAWWAAARKAHGDITGTRALIEVLLLHRHMRHEHVVAGLAMALHAGAVTADAVALHARKYADAEELHPGAAPEPSLHPLPSNVIWLSQRRAAQLPPDHRPLPSVAIYDQLLRHPRTAEGT